MGTGWANTEFRSYTFSTRQADETHLIETTESRRRRMGDEKPLDHNEVTQLKRTKTDEESEFETKQILEDQRQMDMARQEQAAGRSHEVALMQAKA